jgi:glycosyltransferase involved in cell wall biosynthesis
MLSLAEFRGLAPPEIGRLPAVAYFHENQLTYPVRRAEERDLHFAFTNLTTALAADAVWFNSAYHRDAFLEALPEFLGRMPDHPPADAAARIRTKAAVHAPGIGPLPRRGPRRPGPPRILWAARWEHDKNPRALFDAVQELKNAGADFRLSVIGQQFENIPEEFEQARPQFAERIDHWGYLPTAAAYRDCLLAADIVVSTALHEFFGLSVVEAMAAGAYPLLPQRLSYPELLQDVPRAAERFFYDGTPQHLAVRLRELCALTAGGGLWAGDADCCRRAAARFEWDVLAPQMDAALESLHGCRNASFRL